MQMQPTDNILWPAGRLHVRPPEKHKVTAKIAESDVQIHFL